MRKSYDKQFKIAAVKLVLDDEMSVADAAEAFYIHYNSLYRWISEYNAVMESFYRTIKRELIQDSNYESPEQAQREIFK